MVFRTRGRTWLGTQKTSCTALHESILVNCYVDFEPFRTTDSKRPTVSGSRAATMTSLLIASPARVMIVVESV